MNVSFFHAAVIYVLTCSPFTEGDEALVGKGLDELDDKLGG